MLLFYLTLWWVLLSCMMSEQGKGDGNNSCQASVPVKAGGALAALSSTLSIRRHRHESLQQRQHPVEQCRWSPPVGCPKGLRLPPWAPSPLLQFPAYTESSYLGREFYETVVLFLMLSGIDFPLSIAMAVKFCCCEATVLEFIVWMLIFGEPHDSEISV